VVKPWETIPLFDEPTRVTFALSALYAAPLYRRRRGVPAPQYASLATKTLPCDECFANQHESGGLSGHRALAKARRTVAATPRQASTVLNLCRLHEALWVERDEGDMRGA
jgi:hypothetical protein